MGLSINESAGTAANAKPNPVKPRRKAAPNTAATASMTTIGDRPRSVSVRSSSIGG